MSKIFQFPMHICFVDKLGAEDFDDLLPINGWCEGDIITGIKAIYYGVPAENDKLTFRIPMEDLRIAYPSGGKADFYYIGNDEELLEALRRNVNKVNYEEALPMEFED